MKIYHGRGNKSNKEEWHMEIQIPSKREKHSWSKMSVKEEWKRRMKKKNEKGEVEGYKTRLVAKGYKQQQSIHYVNNKSQLIYKKI